MSSKWSASRLKKFRSTIAMKRKAQVTSIPIEMLPVKREPKAPRATAQRLDLEQAKMQLAHEVLQVLMKVLS